ncbi:MAG: alpha/beta hydrolase [Candidatus Eiseniibacteriota bacterium]
MTSSEAGGPAASIVTRGDGSTIAYHLTPGAGPGVVFLTGFRSDMTGGKALALESACRACGRAYLRFDYTGHGASSGDFADGTIGKWTDDAVFAIERLTEGPQVLVGSSMGGWIMLLAARRLGPRVAGLVGIAAAPDFTEDLIWQNADAATRAVLKRDGVWHERSAYDPAPTPITMRLIEEGRRHLLLRGPIALACPVRLIHGMRDPDVPWQTSLRLAECLASRDVEITLVKDGDHRLSTDQDLDRLAHIVDALCRRVVV